jgi:hypothetical protein
LTRVAVLDDWQRVARASADWSPLIARADVHFFEGLRRRRRGRRGLAGFDIILATRRERRPASLVARLPRLKMFGLTGARAGLIDIAG